MRTVHVVCGATYPFNPEVHSTKRSAMKRAAEMRREIRARYPWTNRDCGIRIEQRAFDPARDVLVLPSYPKYGDKRDYPKIDVFERTDTGMVYRFSTTWSRTCRECISRLGDPNRFKAVRAKRLRRKR